MERAIVLAAGRGERLVNGLPFPKPLKRIGGIPLIVRLLRNLERAGVREAVVVVGHLGDVLMRGVRRYSFDLEVRFVRSPAPEGDARRSILAAGELVTGPTLLVMGDTLLSPELLSPLVESRAVGASCTVAADFEPQRCVDLDTAIKLSVDGTRVTAVGRDLAQYTAVTPGAMVITRTVLNELERSGSLEQALSVLSETGDLGAVSIGQAMWIDVDTRQAYAFAERSLARYGEALQPTPLVAGL